MTQMQTRRLARVADALPATATPRWLAAMEERAEHGNPVRFAIWRAARVRAQRRALAVGGGFGEPTEDAVKRELAELAHRTETNADPHEALAGWFAAAADWPPAPGWPNDLTAFWSDVDRHERYLHDLRTSPALADWRARKGRSR